MEFKKLTVIDYGESDGDTSRVTLQAMNISMIRSPEALVKRQGLLLHRVLIQPLDGESTELHVNGADLELLEEAVGFFGSFEG